LLNVEIDKIENVKDPARAHEAVSSARGARPGMPDTHMKTDDPARTRRSAAMSRAAPARASPAWHRIGVESGYLPRRVFKRQT